MATNKTSADDIALFHAQMKGVKRLEQDTVEPELRLPAPYPKFYHDDEQQVLVDMMSDQFELDELETGEELWFVRAGVQKNVLRKLKRGHFPRQAELDLHGLTVVQAREALAEFLQRCKRQRIRCARIIHGKGKRSKDKKPVLKNKLNHWLQQRDEILAFCSAPRVDGGTGAAYILLKR